MSTESSKQTTPTAEATAEGAPAVYSRRERSTWQALKEDDTFRATFVVVFVVPAVLMAGTIAWIVRAMAIN
jgi:hypothetical protein